MDWPHTIAVWQWLGDSPLLDIPCSVTDLSPDRELPPSEFHNLGRQQERRITYRVRCPLWVYPFLQDNAPIAFTASSRQNTINPFGRGFSPNPSGESLFISNVTVRGGILDLELDALVTNPLGISTANIGLPNPPTIPIPPVVIGQLLWYWLPPSQQPEPTHFGFGLPDTLNTSWKARALFEQTVLNPITNIRDNTDVEAFIRTRFRLPLDLNEIKLSVIEGNNTQRNLYPFDTATTIDGSLDFATEVSLVDVGVNNAIGQVGLELFGKRDFISSFVNPPIQTGSIPTFWDNSSRVIVWHNTQDDRNNMPYYDDRITSEWGDTTFTTRV